MERSLSYHEKFFDRLRSENFSYVLGSIPRPEAHGDNLSYFFKPNENPIAAALIVHSTGNDSIYPNGDLILDLLCAKVAVFVFDLDGHGKDSTARMDPQSIFSCVTAALPACRQNMKSSFAERSIPLHLIGQSLGGALALASIVSESVGFASCIAIATPRRVALTASTMIREATGPFSLEFWRTVAHWGLIDAIPATGDFKRNLYPFRSEASNVARNAFWYVPLINGILREASLRADRQMVNIPTLLISGSHDPIAPKQHADEWAHNLPQAKILTVGTQSHLKLLLSRQVRRHVVNWINN